MNVLVGVLLASTLALSAKVDEKGFLNVFGTGRIEGQRQMLVEVWCDHSYASSASEVDPEDVRHYTRMRPFIHHISDEGGEPTFVVMTIGDAGGKILAREQLTLFLR